MTTAPAVGRAGAHSAKRSGASQPACGFAQASARCFRVGQRHPEFPDDGRIEIGSNMIERSMRPNALRKRSALFAGSNEGGQKLGCHHLADRDLKA